MDEIGRVPVNTEGDGTRDRRVVQRKLTQRLPRVQQRVPLLACQRLRERPDDNLAARLRIIGEEDRTETAVSESSANLK
jgi:hypothetical protein